MINTGQFGTQTPLQQSAYNPYGQPNMYENPYMQNQQFNNIMPIGQMGYNQYNQAVRSWVCSSAISTSLTGTSDRSNSS